MPPCVSVVIPTYNRSGLVQLAIDSVLEQTFTDLEVMVVDDGSTDGTTEDLASRYGSRIRYIWQENQGESAARNRGIALTQGRYIAFLDSDDLWLPDKIAKQIDLLESEPNVGVAFCQAWRMNEQGVILPGPPMGSDLTAQEVRFEDLCLRNLITAGGSTAIVRRCLLETIGLFDESIRFGEDWDLWLRASLVTSIKGIPEPLACVRLHEGGQWWFPKRESADRVLADHLRILERAFSGPMVDAKHASSLRDQAIAHEYARAAWVSYAFGEVEQARRQLQSALALDEGTWADEGQLTHSIVGMALLLSRVHRDGLYTPSDYVDVVLRELPDDLRGLVTRRRINACIAVETGYHQLAAGDRVSARRQIMRGVLMDPTWLRNRGVVATLLELMSASALVRAFRSLRGRRTTHEAD